MNAGPKKSGGIPIKTEMAADERGIRLSYDSLHDLAGPANQVCTLTSLLIKQYRDRLGSEADALVDLIQGSMDRLQNLIGGIRLYAQVAGKKGSFEACDTNVVLAGALGSIQTGIHESGATVTHDPLPEVEGDAGQIGYVFVSLMENAIKFRSQDPPRVHVSAASAGNEWIFAVRDNGMGIDPKYHRRIFELFKRVHNDAYPGAGVGLAITERIVEGHGGRIWVESELGRGATFFFSLPRAGRAEPEAIAG